MEKLNGMLGEKRRGQREAMEPLPETDTGNFTSKPQPHGKTQINGDGLK